MALEGPHYRDWEWTTVETGPNGGKIKAAEIDLSDSEQAADRFQKLLGAVGSGGDAIGAAVRSLADSENPEGFIRRHLTGHDIHLIFTSGIEGTTGTTTKKGKVAGRNELSQLTDLEEKPSDSGTNAEAGRDEGRQKSVATSANAADENPESILEGSESSGHMAASEEPADLERAELGAEKEAAEASKETGGRSSSSSSTKTARRGRRAKK
jgi:hypothetical protein